MTVMLDSGIRRGSDIVKALALDADATMIGRAALYGMATAGEDGVTRAIELLGSETKRVMGMLGITSTAGITPEALG